MLSATEAAAALGGGVSRDWLLVQARAGKIAHHRLGRTILFTADDLDAIVAAAAVPVAVIPAAPAARRRRYPTYDSPRQLHTGT